MTARTACTSPSSTEAESVKRLEAALRQGMPSSGARPASMRVVEEPLPPNSMVYKLDPKSIRPSNWANRHASSYETADYAELRQSIASAGVNVQAIKVRPISSSTNPVCPENSSDVVQFEVVFGHRRHQACLDLGLHVSAVVEALSDKELFVEMDRENRAQRPLSPYEQGQMFQLALDNGLYASARALARGLEIDTSLVSKSLSIARLPKEVIQAFASPLDIQFRWAAPLNTAHRKDPDALKQRAEALQSSRGPLSAKRIFLELIASQRPLDGPQATIAGPNGRASIGIDMKGRLAVLIEAPWHPGLRTRLEASLRALFNQR